MKIKNNSTLKIFFILFTVINVFIYGNDMEFLSQGEHIIPLETSDIAIKKERIELKRLKGYGMSVEVKFIFNSGNSGKRIIGFITPRDDYDDDRMPYNPKNIKNFKTKVNGKEVGIKVEKMNTFINKGKFSQSDKDNYLKNYRDAYAYYFEADFKKGENTVEHSYIYSGIISTTSNGDYSYVLSTISRWKNKKVDDFELIVDMGDELFSLPYTFWKNERPINWEIVGEGRKAAEKNSPDEWYNYQGSVYFKIKKGHVRFREKNFSPDREFYAEIPKKAYTNSPYKYVIDSYRGGDTVIDGYIFNDRLMRIGWDIDHEDKGAISEAERMTDFELEIIKNFPFAVYGYDFSRKDLKDYFSKFFWYYPKGKVNVPEYEYEIRMRIINGIQEKRKRR